MQYHLVKDGKNYVVEAESQEEAISKVQAHLAPAEPLPEQTTGEFAAGAAMDLAESALGVGDEVGAAALSVADFFETGEWNWSENIDQARSTLDQFEAENPVLSGAITAAGVTGSLLIPGATALKIAQTGSKLARMGKTAGLVAAEGATYGALAGRGEEGRMQGAVIGGVLGGSLGLGVSVLLRNSDEIAKMAAADKALMDGADDAGHIAGKEGFANAGANAAKRDVSKASDGSTQERKVQRVLTDEEYNSSNLVEPVAEKQTGALGEWLGDTKRWISLNVGERAARLTEDAEWMGKTARSEWVGKIEDKLAKFDDKVNANPQVANALVNLGRGKNGTTWDDVFAAGGDDLAEELTVFKNMYDDLKALDIPGFSTDDWIHTSVRPAPIVKVGKDGVKFKEKRGRLGPDGLEFKQSDYFGSAKAMIEYADELTSANALAERFGIPMSAIKVGKGGKKARIEAVIDAIGKAAKKEGANEDVVNNLKDGLKSVFISSKAGGDAAGAIARKVSSTAYLGSPMNAILNVSEWVTPAFQNNLANWAQQTPKMISYAVKDAINSWSSIGKYGLPKFKHKGLTPESMGLTDQFMGELAAEGQRTFSGWVDTVGKFIYDKSFVTTSNKTGQFAQMNSAVNRGTALAKGVLKGDEKALAKFRKTDGARGLSETEILQTARALAERNLDSPWVRNYAGASLNMWQPVSATALPKAFLDNPNGRMFYSMLTYMNRQMNASREQFGKGLVTAYKRGLNTSEGREAAQTAMKQMAKYTAYYGVGAGVWERYRSSLDESRDIDMDEVMTMEGMKEATMTQIASNWTSGLVDLRAQEYGRGRMNLVPAPVQYAGDVGSGMISGITGAVTGSEQDMTEFYRMLQGNVPGVAAADKMNRLFNDGERLLVQPQDR